MFAVSLLFPEVCELLYGLVVIKRCLQVVFTVFCVIAVAGSIVVIVVVRGAQIGSIYYDAEQRSLHALKKIACAANVRSSSLTGANDQDHSIGLNRQQNRISHRNHWRRVKDDVV